MGGDYLGTILRNSHILILHVGLGLRVSGLECQNKSVGLKYRNEYL